ncbi:MAG: hypothetical protein LRY73_15470 [Bacillus sp. (in: Bacteria)]|nr:hypothetical protein [Bacillus sp. (in: firmicutes)]
MTVSLTKLKRHKVEVSSSHWIGYLLLLSRPKDEEKNKLRGYTLNKDEEKLLYEGYALLHFSIEGKQLKKLGDWHRIFFSYSVEAMLVYVSTLEGNMYDQGLQYLILREKMDRMVDGKVLKSYGLKPGPAFKELLLKGGSHPIKSP